jgi:hypothetical protein
MLATSDSAEQLDELANCRNELLLPPEAQVLLAQSGFGPSRETERRRYPRMRTNQRALLQVLTTLPAIKRNNEWFAARVVDISRNGLGVLHSAQVYPKERVCIVLKDGLTHRAEVVWCQRISDRCYHFGCSLVGSPVR